MSGAAVAQQRPEVPSSILPDIRLEQLTPRPALRMQEAPEIPLPETAPARVPAGAETVRLTFRGFELEGASAYPAGSLEAIWQADEGSEISLARVYALAREIQQRYREDGFFLSRVIVPEQRVRDGRFRLRVLEGFIAKVSFEGDVGAPGTLIARYFARVTEERPARLATVERALLLANDVPGLSATGLLRSSASELGAAELVVSLSRQPISGFMTVDNYGDEFTGEWEASAGLSSNALTAAGEQITIIGFASEPWNDHDEKVGQLASSWRVGGSGLYLETLASYGDSNPGAALDDFEFDSKALLLSFTGGYPVIRSRDRNLSLRLGFDYVNEDTDTSGEKVAHDRLRVVHLAARGDARDALGGMTAAEASVRQGLPILDATERNDSPKSRDEGTGSATLIRGSVARLQPLIESFALYGEVAGQYAFDHLLSEEQFDVGGTQFGRGYDFAETSGDHGVGATIELRYSWRPVAEAPVSLQPFGFYDFGRVWQRGAGEPQTLSSAGGGLRVAAFEFLSLEFTLAKPLAAQSERANQSREPQFLFRSFGRF